MSWIDHTLPSGQVVQERRTAEGGVVFDVIGTDATIDALDAMELGRLAERALRKMALNRTRNEHAEVAIGYLAKAEGAASCSAAGDVGVPEDVTAAVVMIRLARYLLSKAFKQADPGKVLPEDAP
jgi:hypothetical protein